jgi:hypothetical protein
MVVLLHVQAAGREPLRPFGGHAVRTVAWDRFDPAALEPDVDTVVASAPDPPAALDLVTALRAAGDDRPVLLVPDDARGWREVADVRLPGASVVLGGMSGLPDYLGGPDPGRSGPATRPRAVTALPGVPRGSGRQDLYRRLEGHGPTVASRMRSWTIDVTGDPPSAAAAATPTAAAGAAVTAASVAPAVSAVPPGSAAPAAPAVASGGPLRALRSSAPASSLFTAPARPAPVSPPSEPPVEIRLPETAVVTPLDGGRHPVSRPSVPREPEPVPPAPTGTLRAEGPSRRLARALEDPAVLVPAALAQVDRLLDAARTPRALAEHLLGHVGADAVEVLAPGPAGWRTEVTVGDCPGAGTVPDVVDVGGLVAWLESSFDAPVVLDGSDLGAEGSWVLAAQARAEDRTLALVLAWRRPGRSIFDPAAVSAVAADVADASAVLGLAAEVRRLAQALAVVTD